MEGPSENVGDCDTEEMYKPEEQQIGSDSAKPALSNFRVTIFDILWIIIAICTYILDVGFDIYLAYQFYHDGSMMYFYPTLLFIIFPGVVNAITSCIM
jgi:XK-related protein